MKYIRTKEGKIIDTTKENIYPFYFKDYGKTWALTKEELE